MPSEELTPRHLRLFTPREANALLPELMGFSATASEGARQYRDLVARIQAEENLSEDARQAAREDADRIREEVRLVVVQIADHGVEVKGLNPALLDFPAQRNGQDVYICWREDEPSAMHWHPNHEGFAGRQEILDPDDGCWEWCN
jgi:hypothetical protein